MFWIIENKIQLERLISKQLCDIFLELIPKNDSYHPFVSEIIAVFIHEYNLGESYIIPVGHPEGSDNLTLSDVLIYFAQKWPKTIVFNKKKVLYHLDREMPVKCLKMALYLNNKDIPNLSDYNTSAHTFFHTRYPFKENINCIIPLSKHYEKYHNFVTSNKVSTELFEGKTYDFYNDIVIEQFYNIEKRGIGINKEVFEQYFHPRYDKMFIDRDIVHTEYNLFTKVGRPSNSFNSINFAALKKDNNERSSFIAKKSYLVEFDYNSYHPRILSNIIGYDFKGEDVYTHLAKLCFGKEVISDDERSDMKSIVFKYLYTDSNEHGEVEFFKKVKELKEYLWGYNNKKGYIISPISKRKLYHIDSKVKTLPYLCLALETERNAKILEKINKLLIFAESNLVLYTYDSFLFDYDKADGKELLEDIQHILEIDNYKTSIKYGKNYGSLRNLT